MIINREKNLSNTINKGEKMPIFKQIQESEAKGKVKEIFDEIKSVRQITEVPNFWNCF